MLNKAFSQLTKEEQFQKLDIVIRQNTANLLNAEHIKAMVDEIHWDCQYIVMVHPVNRGSCEALVTDNVLHIFIPANKINKERELNHKQN